MRRIPTLFRRDPDDRRYVLPAVAPGCEWVLAGEGVATRQYDGLCVLYAPELDPGVHPAQLGALDGWWVRIKVRPGVGEPPHFHVVESVPGGTSIGWQPAEATKFAGPLAQAAHELPTRPPEPGTYELIGPKVHRNAEKVRGGHQLVAHARAPRVDAPRSYEGLRDWLPGQRPIEGVVWQHEDGRMAKIKRRDFPRG